MKKSINIKSLILIGIIGVSAVLSSCVKQDFAEPDAITPSFTIPAGANLLTIQQLKARHTTPTSLDSIVDDVYIQGVVTGNDQFGNIYKTLYIQDSTSGIVLSLNKTSLFNEYKQGQRIYVKCKNLVLGSYGGTLQLGAIYMGGTGQLPEIAVANHLFKNGMPGAVPEPTHLRASADLAINLSKLVILDSCSFSEAGMPFVSDNLTTDRGLKLKDGTTITVRTSNYAAFKNSIIPAGKGTVIGLLGLYNGTYQLAIRNINDVYGFIPPIADASFVTDPLAWAAPNTWTTQNVTGTQVWAFDASYKMMKMSGYAGANYENEDWLISPSYSTINIPSAILSFDHAAKYGSPSTELHVMISTDYNGANFATATWAELTVPNWPSGADWTFIGSGDIDLSSYLNQANVRIAFKYTSTTSSGATWEIKALNIRR
ncbi:MAG: DUF5689 domain-containing protein [Bacteroidota bacterium]